MQESADTLNRKLKRITQLYRLANTATDVNAVVIDAVTSKTTYQSLILPTHGIVTGTSYVNEPINYNYDNLSLDDYPTNAGLGVNSNSNLNSNSNSGEQRATIIIGHRIAHNGGIPCTNLSKIPSYQWGFKHEDETDDKDDSSSHHKHSVQVSTTHGNFNSNTILNGLDTLQGSSISSLAGNVTTNNSGGLNSRMIRLPIRNESGSNVNAYDMNNCLEVNNVIQGGRERSLLNGLPYYNKQVVERLIRSLNIAKKHGFKASNTSTSWFKTSSNETVDDIEYLHGEVIHNQFVNNKRMVRNYQWLLYWDEKINTEQRKLNSMLESVEGIMTMKQFAKFVEVRKEKFAQVVQKKVLLKQEMEKLMASKEQRKREYAQQHGELPNLLDEDVEKEVFGIELLQREKEIMDEMAILPDDVKEVDVTEEELAQAQVPESPQEPERGEEKENSLSHGITTLVERTRFGKNSEYNLTHELVIDKELNIDDPLLVQLQTVIHGEEKGLQIIKEAKSHPRYIKSKVVKVKKQPNPNSLGFSNIKSRKPLFM